MWFFVWENLLSPFSVLNSVSSKLRAVKNARNSCTSGPKGFMVNVVRIAFYSQFVCSEYLLDKKVIVCLYNTNSVKCRGGTALIHHHFDLRGTRAGWRKHGN